MFLLGHYLQQSAGGYNNNSSLLPWNLNWNRRGNLYRSLFAHFQRATTSIWTIPLSGFPCHHGSVALVVSNIRKVDFSAVWHDHQWTATQEWFSSRFWEGVANICHALAAMGLCQCVRRKIKMLMLGTLPLSMSSVVPPGALHCHQKSFFAERKAFPFQLRRFGFYGLLSSISQSWTD